MIETARLSAVGLSILGRTQLPESRRLASARRTERYRYKRNASSTRAGIFLPRDVLSILPGAYETFAVNE